LPTPNVTLARLDASDAVTNWQGSYEVGTADWLGVGAAVGTGVAVGVLALLDDEAGVGLVPPDAAPHAASRLAVATVMPNVSTRFILCSPL
jgi:hypothetical protein